MIKSLIAYIFMIIVTGWTSPSHFAGNSSEPGQVKIVRNNARKGLWEKDKLKTVRLEFMYKLGETDAIGKTPRGEDILLYYPQALAIGPEGRIFVLDRERYQVLIFDRNGKFLFNFGRKGGAPGEFRRTFDIEIDGEGRVYVSDSGNNRIQIFSADGHYITSFKGKKHSIQQFALAKEGLLYDASPSTDYRVHVYDGKGELLRSFGPTIQYKDFYAHFLLNLGWAEVDDSGNLYLCYAYKYEVEKYNSQGQLLLLFSRESPLGKSSWTPEEIQEFVKKTGNPPGGILSGVTVDEKDLVYVWLYTHQKEEGYTIVDIFNSDGIYLQSLKLPFKASPIKVRDSKLYAVDFENGQIWCYAIVKISP